MINPYSVIKANNFRQVQTDVDYGEHTKNDVVTFRSKLVPCKSKNRLSRRVNC